MQRLDKIISSQTSLSRNDVKKCPEYSPPNDKSFSLT